MGGRGLEEIAAEPVRRPEDSGVGCPLLAWCTRSSPQDYMFTVYSAPEAALPAFMLAFLFCQPLWLRPFSSLLL